MEKEDVKVLIHAGLALVGIFGGFALVELYGKPAITAGAVGMNDPKITDCVQVLNLEHKSISDKNINCWGF